MKQAPMKKGSRTPRVVKIGNNITISGKREHLKASERYVDVIFKYPKSRKTWKGSVPIEYRRTGISARADKEIEEIVKRAYEEMDPEKRKDWLGNQKEFWKHLKKEETWDFFNKLKDSKWKCVECQLPRNPNPARRIQALKELGYTIATIKSFCRKCNKKTTHYILTRLMRGARTGYELVPPELRKRILEVLNYHDAYENRKNKHLVPDHKFPEIRWDESVREEISDDITDDKIRRKFQLLTNQRNEQKREVCRGCFQTGHRGTPFGINFFYEGNEKWPKEVPKRGKTAEKGCVGCGWYDLDCWRRELNKIPATKAGSAS